MNTEQNALPRPRAVSAAQAKQQDNAAQAAMGEIDRIAAYIGGAQLSAAFEPRDPRACDAVLLHDVCTLLEGAKRRAKCAARALDASSARSRKHFKLALVEISDCRATVAAG